MQPSNSKHPSPQTSYDHIQFLHKEEVSCVINANASPKDYVLNINNK